LLTLLFSIPRITTAEPQQKIQASYKDSVVIATLEPPKSLPIEPSVQKAQDIVSGKIKPGSPTLAKRAKPLATKGNGECLPYARRATGVDVYGAAKFAPSQAKKAGYEVTKAPIAPTGMVVTNESRRYGHAAKYTLRDDGMLLINEQNYLGKYIVSERIISPSSPVIVAFISTL
jgi:hypothetical protein